MRRARERLHRVSQERQSESCADPVCTSPLHAISWLITFVDMVKVREDLEKLYDDGYRSIAIVFCHSYTYPEHELQVAALARTLGFSHVSASSQLLPMIKMVPRGVSSTADAYLTPILREYIDGFFSGFDDKLKDGKVLSPRVEFMGSDGGLVDLNNFTGLKSILSGPAGGVVGYALTSWDEEKKIPIIGCAYIVVIHAISSLTRC